MTIDLGTVISSGWASTVFLLLLIGVGVPYMLATDRLNTRGRLRAVEKDRDYWRRAAELERDRSDRAQQSVSRMLPAAENAVRVVQAWTEVADRAQTPAIERGDTR